MNYKIILKGGPGSGNFDHKGIPGHKGGSLPRYSDPNKNPPELQALIDYRLDKKGIPERDYDRAVRKVAADIAEKIRRRDAATFLTDVS